MHEIGNRNDDGIVYTAKDTSQNNSGCDVPNAVELYDSIRIDREGLRSRSVTISEGGQSAPRKE